ncbi:MAG: carboxypeptidase M32 [Gaiellales bacterium]
MPAAYDELRERLAQVSDLGRVIRVLGWDQQVIMPRGGAAPRAEQLATMRRVVHERFTDDEVGRLLEELRPYEESLPHDSNEASLVRVARREYEKARRVPADLAAELARAASDGHEVWLRARAESDFPRFLPALERNVELKHRYIDCFEPAAEPYDTLLDDYEEGATAAEVRVVFDRVKEALVPLIASVREAAPLDDGFLDGPWPIDRQQLLVRSILDRLGFDEGGWRLDLTAHPFASLSGLTDIRITTRYAEDSLTGLFASIHEFGHGLYEAGSAPELDRTPICGGVSLGLHESQSRLWENLVGRSRPFWRRFYPEIRDAFPETLGRVSEETFWRGVNRVHPSLIRVEADEVTYGMHVILRFELEQEILSGAVALRDLPEAWNARMKEYLGVDVPSDADGVLQDVHWSGGIIGYFPTYLLGSIMSVQIWERLRRDLPELDDQIEAGEFGPLAEWLREHLHSLGAKLTPKETLARVVGGPLDPEPYIAHLRGKVAEVYGVTVS